MSEELDKVLNHLCVPMPLTSSGASVQSPIPIRRSITGNGGVSQLEEMPNLISSHKRKRGARERLDG